VTHLHYLYGSSSVVRTVKCGSLMMDWTCSLNVGDTCLLHLGKWVLRI
jgi:hypothetical protein